MPKDLFIGINDTLLKNFQPILACSAVQLAAENEKNCRLYTHFVGKIPSNRFSN
jgi:hypothetical protein